MFEALETRADSNVGHEDEERFVYGSVPKVDSLI